MSHDEIMAAIRRVLTPEYVGEGVHTSLRKGCENGTAAHRAISAMPDQQWHDAMSFFTEGVLTDIEREISEAAS